MREISLGDYVLNGGEVAALAITEAVVRLLPGFMGNPESLVEESHEDGLLEYPVYTKPASWRGLDVPAVLLSGDHAAIAALAPRAGRTPYGRAPTRPRCDRPSLLDELEVRPAVPADAGELLTLQRACWVPRSATTPASRSPRSPRRSTTSRPGSGSGRVLVVRGGGRLVGAVRAQSSTATSWDIGRLMVAPDLQGRGLGRYAARPDRGGRAAGGHDVRPVHRRRQPRNQRMYKKAGYRLRRPGARPGAVRMTKRGRR